MTRKERARADTSGLTSWKIDLAGTVAAAAVGIPLGAALGWPGGAWGVLLGLGSFACGLALAVAGEYALNLLLADGRAAKQELAQAAKELEELRANSVTLEAFERQSKQQGAAYREQHAQLQRAITILEAHNKVLWGVWQEHDTSGHHVPLAAVLARQELEREKSRHAGVRLDRRGNPSPQLPR